MNITEVERIILENQSAIMAALVHIISKSDDFTLETGIIGALYNYGLRTTELLKK